jgi:uncharacterized membrane protein YdcZ (DUF606 family)
MNYAATLPNIGVPTGEQLVSRAQGAVKGTVEAAKEYLGGKGTGGTVFQLTRLKMKEGFGFLLNTLCGEYNGQVNSKIWLNAANKGLELNSKTAELAWKVGRNLPGTAKALTLVILGGLAFWNIGRGMSKGYTAWSTARSQHSNSAHEGVAYNLIQSSLHLVAGVPVALSYVFKSCGVMPRFTASVLKSIPVFSAATAVGLVMDHFARFAQNKHYLAETAYLGVKNPFLDPNNHYVNPLFPIYENFIGWDNHIGIKRIPHAVAKHSPLIEVDPTSFIGRHVVGEVATG